MDKGIGFGFYQSCGNRGIVVCVYVCLCLGNGGVWWCKWVVGRGLGPQY